MALREVVEVVVASVSLAAFPGSTSRGGVTPKFRSGREEAAQSFVAIEPDFCRDDDITLTLLLFVAERAGCGGGKAPDHDDAPALVE